MPYVEGQTIHDADSHIMELPGTINPYIDPKFRDRFVELAGPKAILPGVVGEDPRKCRTTRSSGPATRRTCCCARTTRRWAPSAPPTGPRRSTTSGFASQLVFTTACLSNFGLEQMGEVELALETARAHNRMMTEFCSVDRRLLATAYVPLVDRAARAADRPRGASRWAPRRWSSRRAIRRASRPATSSFDPLWALAQEARPADPFPRRRRGEDGEGLSGERPAVREGLPWRRRELHLADLHDHPAVDLADAVGPGDRRGVRPLPAAEVGRDRAGRLMAAQPDAVPGFRRPRPSARRSGCRSSRPSPAKSCAASSAPRPIRTRTPAGSSRTPARRCCCSRPTSRTSRAAATR